MTSTSWFELTQLILLTINAALFWKYVKSTDKIKDAALSQANTALQQASSAAEQARYAADQVEGASRPVLVLDGDGTKLRLVNVGTGPALNVKWWLGPTE